MPTYDYECKKCGRSFEYFQRMVDDPLKKCTLNGCNGKVIRLIGSGAGIIFKGSGFYETDYKRKTEGKKEKDDQKKDKSTAKKEPGSSTKPSPAAGGKSESNKKADSSASKGD